MRKFLQSISTCRIARAILYPATAVRGQGKSPTEAFLLMTLPVFKKAAAEYYGTRPSASSLM